MKITGIKLENVSGIYVGQNKNIIEIDFSNSKNKLISIQGKNAVGKSVLLASLTPYGYPFLDERNSLSYIIPGKNGYKELRCEDKDKKFVFKHYFKANKDTHLLKSYFQLNGEELNENGNVTSFISLVEIHLGLTQEMIRLIKLGSNLNSFISLKPAERKNYISHAKDAKFKVAGYYFQSSISSALDSNDQRPKNETVPRVALLATHKKLELPQFSEGFDVLYYVCKDNMGGFIVEEYHEI